MIWQGPFWGRVCAAHILALLPWWGWGSLPVAAGKGSLQATESWLSGEMGSTSSGLFTALLLPIQMFPRTQELANLLGWNIKNWGTEGQSEHIWTLKPENCCVGEFFISIYRRKFYFPLEMSTNVDCIAKHQVLHVEAHSMLLNKISPWGGMLGDIKSNLFLLPFLAYKIQPCLKMQLFWHFTVG